MRYRFFNVIPVQRKLCPACGVSPAGTPQLITGRLDWRTDPADELFSDLPGLFDRALLFLRNISFAADFIGPQKMDSASGRAVMVMLNQVLVVPNTGCGDETRPC